MAYRVFTLPVRDTGAAERELNGFLASHRVLSVDRRFVEEDRAAVVRTQEEEANSFAALAFDQVGETAGAFGAAHFAADGVRRSPAR